MYSGKKGFAADVRDEIYAEESLHRKRRLEKCTKRNGNINYTRTSVLSESMVLFSRYKLRFNEQTSTKILLYYYFNLRN